MTCSLAPMATRRKVLLARFFRSEEHTSELQSQSNLVCRLLLEKKKNNPVRSSASNLYKYLAKQYSLRTYHPPTSGYIHVSSHRFHLVQFAIAVVYNTPLQAHRF